MAQTNGTDPCSAHGTSLSNPTNLDTPYAAVGPISNFTAAVTSCCPHNGTVSNYAGGSAPQSCYYYCAFNGTVEDMRETMACNRGAADERRREAAAAGNNTVMGYIGIGYHPDLDSSAGVSVYEAPKWGAWKCVVLALGVVAITAGAL